MSVEQLSVFIENKAGRITTVASVLAQAGVNIRGFSVSDSEHFGIVRVIADDPERGASALEDAGFVVKRSPVIVVNLTDHPGGLAAVLKTISDAGIEVEYIYSLIATYLAFDVEDTERATALLGATDVSLLEQSDLK